MRPQQNRRIRGRSNNNNNNNNNRRGSNPLTRSYESNGPDVKIRGNAQHIADKYAALARDVQAAGDRVMAENYLQHAEHYMRIILSAQPQFVPAPRAELAFDETDADNIVDLPLAESGGAGERQAEEENHLQLIVNREVDDTADDETSRLEKKADERAASQAAAPKIERPRRVARRRLPRQDEADILSVIVADAPSSLSDKPIDEKMVELQAEKQQEEEKPRRRRRVVKVASVEAVSE